MVNNYDKIANHYDVLSRLVFFKSQVNAQIDQLKYIPANANVLVVGGGTGWILEEIAKVHPSGLLITYVEISSKMIGHSKARDHQKNNVEFINCGIEVFETQVIYDVVLTPFLFDNFSEESARNVFQKLNNLLKENAFWFLTDFTLAEQNGHWWKWLMLKSMYLFFKAVGIVEATDLVEIAPYFYKANYHVIEERFYYAGFIKASVYKKKKIH